MVAAWEAGVSSEADRRELEEEFGDLLFPWLTWPVS